MLNAKLERAKVEFEKRGYVVEVKNCGYLLCVHQNTYTYEDGGKLIHVEMVDKHNGTEEDVTLDFTVFVYEDHSGRRQNTKKIRCKYTASDKVLNRRLDDVIELYERV